MKIRGKKFLLTMLLGTLCVFAVSGQTNAANLDAAIQRAGTDIRLKFFGGPKVALVSINSEGDKLSEYVINELTVALGSRQTATFISRQQIDNALGAMNLNAFGEVSDGNARQIGRNVGATFVVTGSVVRTGDKFRLRARLLTAATSSALTESSYDIGIIDCTHIYRLLGEEPPALPPAAAAPAPAPAPVSYKVGDTGPAGGIIFFNKGNKNGGWQYLEAAPYDTNRESRPVTERIKARDIKDRGIGKGKTNTGAILKEAVRNDGGFNWAAHACSILNINGYTDWFLPSRDELQYMYGNLHIQGMGNFKNEKYWSSTSKNSSGSRWWCEDFSNGKNKKRSFRREYNVRAIRQF